MPGNSFAQILRHIRWKGVSTVAMMLKLTNGKSMIENVSWDKLSNDIQNGCPSFGGVDGLENSEAFRILGGESFLAQVRKTVCRLTLLQEVNRFAQIEDVPPIAAMDFYYQTRRLDKIVLNFLFESMHNLEVVTHISRDKINQLIENLGSAIPLLKGIIMFDDETLQKIVFDYGRAFVNEIRKRDISNAPLSLENSVIKEAYAVFDEPSWSDTLSFYLSQPYVMGTVVIGFLGLGFCWKTRRDRAQQHQTLELFEPVMEYLPGDNWQMECFLDRAGVKISYWISMKEHLLLSKKQGGYSVTKDDFMKYFTTHFSKITVGKERCQISVEDVVDEKEHNSQQMRLQLPPVSDVDKVSKSLVSQFQLAYGDLLSEVKDSAPETQIPKLLRTGARLIAPYGKEVMPLLRDELNVEKYQQIIDQITKFIKGKVLNNVYLSDHMSEQFGILSRDSFVKLSEYKKLEALLWLYRQLNTIAQLILNPHASVTGFVSSKSYVQFYRPFAKAIQPEDYKNRSFANDLRVEAGSFVGKLNQRVCKFSSEKDDLSDHSILMGVKVQLNNLVTTENEIRRDFIDDFGNASSDDLKLLEPAKRCQRLEELKVLIKKMERKISPKNSFIIPISIVNLITFMADSGGGYASKLIECIPNLTPKKIEELSNDINKKIIKRSRQSQECKSEETNIWLTRSEKLIDEETRDPVQINLALFYCLSRIVVSLAADHPSLERVRYLLGHFGYTLDFESRTLSQQLFELSSRLVSEPSEINDTGLYQKLASYSRARDESAENQDKELEDKIISEAECQTVEETVRGLQTVINACPSDLTSNKESDMIQGVIILFGQAANDFDRRGFATQWQDCLKECVSIRNGLMHEPSYSVLKENLESTLKDLKQSIPIPPQDANKTRCRSVI